MQRARYAKRWYHLHTVEVQKIRDRETQEQDDHDCARLVKEQYSSREGVGGLLKVMDSLRSRGKKVGRVTYNTALRVCTRHRALQQAQQIFADMTRNRVVPGVTTYNHLLLTAGKLNKTETVQAVYTEMMEKGIKGNVITYTAIIQSLMRTEPGLVEGVWKAMLADGVVPDDRLYLMYLRGSGTTATAVARLEMVEREVAEKKHRWDMRPFYGAAVKVAAWNKNVKVADQYFTKMLETGHVPQVEQWTALISAYAGVGDVTAAYEVLNRMTAHSVEPTPVTHATLITACANSLPPDVAVAERVFALAFKQSPRDPVLWNALLRVYAAAGCVTEAKKAVAMMHARKISTSKTEYFLRKSAENSRAA